MAIVIKSIPILKKKSAKSFVKKADNSLSLKGSVDFSQQVKVTDAILKKAKLR
jgi:hypothetical protein